MSRVRARLRVRTAPGLRRSPTMPAMLLTLAALLALAMPAVSLAQAASPRLIGYYTEWSVYQRKYHVADVPAQLLTHLNYAFAKPTAAGECVLADAYAATDKFYPGDSWEPGQLRGNLRQLQRLKAKHPRLRTLISVGGYSHSGPFSDLAHDPALRRAFARSCAEFVAKYGFDGVDLDWEYPVGGGHLSTKTRATDRENCTLLVAELRRELEQRSRSLGRKLELSLALPATPALLAHFELDKLHPHVDWFNVMAYDFVGPWSATTGFNAPLYACSDDANPDEVARTKHNADAAVRAIAGAGVPNAKIVLGVPFYGRAWAGVTNLHRGLFQPFAKNQPAPGTREPGILEYRDLRANYLPKMQRYFHDEAKCAWLYDPARRWMISYEDPETLTAKAQFIRQRGLGGAMVWELAADDEQATLLTTLHDQLNR